MIIETKNWSAQNDLMPSPDGGIFRVRGTVVVAHPGIVPVLTLSKMQDKSFALNVDLRLEEQGGAFIQVVTEKEVLLELKGDHSNVPWVTVIHDGQTLVRIDEIMTTY